MLERPALALAEFDNIEYIKQEIKFNKYSKYIKFNKYKHINITTFLLKWTAIK